MDFVKNKRRSCLNAVFKNGVLTSRDETVRAIIDAHFPKNSEEVFSYLDRSLDPEPTLTNQNKIQVILNNMKNGRAPGIDEISKDIIEKAFKRSPPTFINILTYVLLMATSQQAGK